MLVIHNAHRTGVVTVFDGLRLRFGTDYAGVGTLFSAYVLGYGIAQSIVGLVGDRFSAKRLLVTGLAASALFSALFAGTASYGAALAARFLLGATGALLYTPAMKLGIVLFKPEERGRVLGVLQAGAGIGSSGAMILVPALAGLVGLSGAFLSLSLLTAVTLVAAASVLPGEPGIASSSHAHGEPARLTRRGDFWQLLAASLIGMLAMYGILTWLPTYLTADFGYTEVWAGTVASLANLTLLVAAPIVGWAADLPRGRIMVVTGGSLLAVLVFGLLALSPWMPFVVAATLLSGVSLSATTAPFMLLAGERFGAGQTARVVGLMATAGQLGATLAGSVFGFVLERGGGFQAVWLACGAFALVRLVLLLDLIRRDRRRPRASDAAA